GASGRVRLARGRASLHRSSAPPPPRRGILWFPRTRTTRSAVAPSHPAPPTSPSSKYLQSSSSRLWIPCTTVVSAGRTVNGHRGRIGEHSAPAVRELCTVSSCGQILVIRPCTSAPAWMPVVPHCPQSYPQLGRTWL